MKLLGSRISMIDYGSDPNGKFDKDLSEDAILFINEALKKKFVYHDSLDDKPIGGFTPSQPEAIFKDPEGGMDLVIELKTFDYSSVAIMHKVKKINNYCTQILKRRTDLELNDNVYIFIFELYKDDFNPNRFIEEMEGIDLFSTAYRNKHALLKVIQLKKGASLKKLKISYNIFKSEYPNNKGEFRYMYSNPIDADRAIQIALDYDGFAEKLKDDWLDKDSKKKKPWNRKFILHEDKFKVLFIDFNMKSECGYAYMNGFFDPLKFVENFVEKYSSEVSLNLVNLACFRFEQRIITVHYIDGKYVCTSHPDGCTETVEVQPSSSNTFII